MNFNKAFFLKKEDHEPAWEVIDAEGQILGRLATQLADKLRGKHKADYTPHTDGGDYIVIINAEKIKMTGDKLTDKEYVTYSGWIGGQKTRTAKEMLEKHPTDVITLAVKRMLPKSKLAAQVLKKLKVYAGPNHPHKAQVKSA